MFSYHIDLRQLVRYWGICPELLSFPSGRTFTHGRHNTFNICLKLPYPHYRQRWRRSCWRSFTVRRARCCWRNGKITLIPLQQTGAFLQQKSVFFLPHKTNLFYVHVMLPKRLERLEKARENSVSRGDGFFKDWSHYSCPASPYVWGFFPLETSSSPQWFTFLCQVQWRLNYLLDRKHFWDETLSESHLRIL